MIIDHIGIAISDYDRSKQFYSTVLATLEIELLIEVQGWAVGPDEKTQHPMHIAFAANSRQQVDDFYHAAIAAGASDNGKPGVREIYHPNYYGAFVIDPDGHNIEAVCHQAAGT